VIALLVGEMPVRERLAECAKAFLSSTLLRNLYYAVWKSSRATANLAQVEDLTAAMTILPCDTIPARLYGEIKASPMSKDGPIPENDIWIAAAA
jgi:tRNA(fMet)-specific endonuclease VapC